MLKGQEAFYGGAAAGGKSDALLMAALQYVDVPGYAAILFRRTYKDLALPGALMDRAAAWLAGTAATWDGAEKQWLFPTADPARPAVLAFGYLDTEQHKWRYQSAEFQFVGFDELTHFTEAQYTYLFSRLRRLKGATVPIRMRAASNPGGVGHDWVKQRFIVTDRPAERIFIRARLEDNPYVDEIEYDRALAHLDAVTRAQLRAGDWSVRPEGGKFRREWFRIVDEVPADMRLVRYWDLAATEPRAGIDPDWTAGVLMGLKEGIYWLLNVVRIRATARGVEDLIRQTALLDGPRVEIFMEQEGGASGKSVVDHYAREVLVGYAFRGDRPSGSKEIRATPMAAAAEVGNVRLASGPWIADFLDEIAMFPQPGVHDDQVDAASGAFARLAFGAPTLTVPAARMVGVPSSGGRGPARRW